jgi:DNA-directed RNA polymerase specialized sigma24 family protein
VSDSPTGTAAGRARRFEDVYLQEFASVFGLAYALTGGRWAAEDIAQDAFVDAHRQWGRVGGYDDPGAWVRRVAANLAVSGVRRRLAEARALVRLTAHQRQQPYATCQARTATSGGRCGGCRAARPRWWRCSPSGS